MSKSRSRCRKRTARREIYNYRFLMSKSRSRCLKRTRREIRLARESVVKPLELTI